MVSICCSSREAGPRLPGMRAVGWPSRISSNDRSSNSARRGAAERPRRPDRPRSGPGSAGRRRGRRRGDRRGAVCWKSKCHDGPARWRSRALGQGRCKRCPLVGCMGQRLSATARHAAGRNDAWQDDLGRRSPALPSLGRDDAANRPLRQAAPWCRLLRGGGFQFGDAIGADLMDDTAQVLDALGEPGELVLADPVVPVDRAELCNEISSSSASFGTNPDAVALFTFASVDLSHYRSRPGRYTARSWIYLQQDACNAGYRR